jgi:hypothetical protein
MSKEKQNYWHKNVKNCEEIFMKDRNKSTELKHIYLGLNLILQHLSLWQCWYISFGIEFDQIFTFAGRTLFCMTLKQCQHLQVYMNNNLSSSHTFRLHND